MSLFSTAREIYLATKDNPTAIAQVRDARASLALEMATTSDGGLDLTSATVAGNSFAGLVSMTKQQRLKVLGVVVGMYDADAAISSRGIAAGRTQ